MNKNAGPRPTTIGPALLTPITPTTPGTSISTMATSTTTIRTSKPTMCVRCVAASGGSSEVRGQKSEDKGQMEKDIFSFGNIYRCYLDCRRNKRNTINALKFEINAEENILKLERELNSKAYRPSRSILFAARKPKLREIFAADFKDRVVHHVLVDYLERIWEKIFIYNSYACRKNKGTHRAVMRLQSFLRKVSKNGKRKAYYLQLDIKDFFTSIDKKILFDMIKKRVHPVRKNFSNGVKNRDVLWLTEKIIFWDCTTSFILRDRGGIIKRIPPNKSIFGKDNKKGLPIGNLTSQFFGNVYLNELDQFIKHTLKAKYYIRYVDDFVLLGETREELVKWMKEIETFLETRLSLRLHPRRRKLQPISNGINFLGYIARRDYILVRRRVINNMKARLRHFERLLVPRRKFQKSNVRGQKSPEESLRLPTGQAEGRKAILKDLQSSIHSYLGHLKWANSYNLVKKLAKELVISTYFKINGYRLVPILGRRQRTDDRRQRAEGRKI